ncbi:type I DNA topoisomerase [Paraglaciecola sp. L3A3]|uniref:DNA topoisomerase family protein n=1 Tax=Paraglaciecola sp. L3A3 TaxID=2686358 RepID=UPI00131E3192|nr:topoisomerase DNA-binding C4 zinc finger domain-containing protein [Paraglaciecola sp. L3A3]
MSKIDHSLFSTHDQASEQAFGPCPKCQAKLNIRRGKSGAFIGCSNYPECDFSKPLHEYENADIKVIDGSSCPLCQSSLVIKKGRFGLFIGCSDFPTCHYIESTNKAEETTVSCPACKKGHLSKRANKFGKSFYSCDQYPKCKYVLNSPPVTATCPECQWPVLIKKVLSGKEVLQCPQKLCGYKKSVE